MKEERFEEPAMAMISVSRVSGHRELFQVDYPQQHYISLEINPAYVVRSLSTEWVYSMGRSHISVCMSEVQWARLLSSMNTSGVPCTVECYWDRSAGKFVSPELTSNFKANAATFAKEVKDDAEEVGKRLSAVDEYLAKILKQPSIKKSEVATALGMIRMANQEISSNLPFVVQQAERAVEKIVESAKGEIAAYSDFRLHEIGIKALGEKFAALPAQEAIKALGNALSNTQESKNENA